MSESELIEKIEKLIDEYEAINYNVVRCDIGFLHTKEAFAWNGEKLVSIPFSENV